MPYARENTGEDGITPLEAGHATSHLDHETRQSLPSVAGMKPEDGLKCSFRDHVIDWIEADGVDLNENFIRPRRRLGNVGERDLIGPGRNVSRQVLSLFVFCFKD